MIYEANSIYNFMFGFLWIIEFKERSSNCRLARKLLCRAQQGRIKSQFHTLSGITLQQRENTHHLPEQKKVLDRELSLA